MSLVSPRFCILLAVATAFVSFGAYADDDLYQELPQVEESAPQEPPYTSAPLDSEFDSIDKQPAEVLQVPEETPPVVAAPEPPSTGTTANQHDDFYKRKDQTSEPLVRQERPEPGSGKSRIEHIHHPLAAKGLLKIEKDGTYVYKVKESSHNQSAAFRFGVLQPPQIQGPYADFKSMYSDSNIPIVFFDYEWQPFSRFGKLGIQAGLGFFTAQGQGRFKDIDPKTGDNLAREKYTFLAFPVNLGAVYRLEWMNRQWIAPYIAGGGTYFAIVESRDDSKSPSLVGSPGVYGAGGAMFNITALDRDTAFTMSSEYGISNLWLTAEFRYIKSLNEDLDFTSSVLNVGFAVDY